MMMIMLDCGYGIDIKTINQVADVIRGRGIELQPLQIAYLISLPIKDGNALSELILGDGWFMGDFNHDTICEALFNEQGIGTIEGIFEPSVLIRAGFIHNIIEESLNSIRKGWHHKDDAYQIHEAPVNIILDVIIERLSCITYDICEGECDDIVSNIGFPFYSAGKSHMEMIASRNYPINRGDASLVRDHLLPSYKELGKMADIEEITELAMAIGTNMGYSFQYLDVKNLLLHKRY